MTSSAEPRRGLPIDPDVDAVEDARHHRRPEAETALATRWPRFAREVLLVVFVGGCLGGLVRHLVIRHWPGTGDGVPWSTLVVNLAGAFLLAVIVVAATRNQQQRWLRPLLGTGFCGALTTMSSVVVSADELYAHHHPGAGTAYLALTLLGCLAAAAVGFVAARSTFAARGASA